MLRHVGLLHAQLLDQFPGREFTVAKEFEYCDASRMGECLKNLGLEAANGVLHIISICYYSNMQDSGCLARYLAWCTGSQNRDPQRSSRELRLCNPQK